jgi:hypothetical protein
MPYGILRGSEEDTGMQNNAFSDSAVHGALLNSGLTATYRNLEGRLTLSAPGTPIPDLPPEGV